MRAAEFLRGLADMLSAIEDDKPAQAPVIVNVNGGNAAPAVTPEVEQEDEMQDDPTMVPPLQQKLEIMKKLAGLPNQTDKTIPVVADEDEPYEG